MKLTAIYFKNILPSNITPKTFKRKYNIIQMIKMRIALRLLIFWTIMENAQPPPKLWNPTPLSPTESEYFEIVGQISPIREEF